MNIQINEIRVGNLYKNDKNWIKIFTTFDFEDLIYYKTKTFTPIPLDEFIMGKFGFKRHKMTGASGQDQWAGMDAWSLDGKEWLFRGDLSCLHLVGYFNTQVKYAHELQNLVFYLLKIELVFHGSLEEAIEKLKGKDLFPEQIKEAKKIFKNIKNIPKND